MLGLPPPLHPPFVCLPFSPCWLRFTFSFFLTLSLSASFSFFFLIMSLSISPPFTKTPSLFNRLPLFLCPSCTSGFYHGYCCSCLPSISPTGQPPFFVLFFSPHFLSEPPLTANLSGLLNVSLSVCFSTRSVISSKTTSQALFFSLRLIFLSSHSFFYTPSCISPLFSLCQSSVWKTSCHTGEKDRKSDSRMTDPNFVQWPLFAIQTWGYRCTLNRLSCLEKAHDFIDDSTMSDSKYQNKVSNMSPIILEVVVRRRGICVCGCCSSSKTNQQAANRPSESMLKQHKTSWFLTKLREIHWLVTTIFVVLNSPTAYVTLPFVIYQTSVFFQYSYIYFLFSQPLY